MDKNDQQGNMKDQDPNSLYCRIGGDGKISDLIDQFYYKVLFDKTLRKYFYKANMSRVRLQQKIFFSCQLFGAQGQKYEGRDIIELHKNLGISSKNFDTFKKHLENILLDMEKSREVIEEILDKVESQRQYVVTKIEDVSTQEIQCPFISKSSMKQDDEQINLEDKKINQVYAIIEEEKKPNENDVQQFLVQEKQ